MIIWLLSETESTPLENLTTIPQDGFIWINADQTELNKVLAVVTPLTKVQINEEHIQDCQNLQHPSFYERTPAYDILIFRSLVGNESCNIIETTPITFFVFPKILITFNKNDEAIGRVLKKLSTMNKKSFIDSTYLMLVILDEIVDNFLLLRTPLMERYNNWENLLFDRSTRKVDWLQYLNFKTDVRKLRVSSEDQLDIIYQWRQDNEPAINELLSIRYNDLFDHIKRVIRSTTQLESELDTLTQLHYSLIGNRTNDTMRTLTVLSGVFLPLNLIAGIFGMNFTHMTVLQSYYALDVTLWGMLILSAVLVLIFWWKEWI